MERSDMIQEILSRVMEKLSEAGETVTGMENLQETVAEALEDQKRPGILVLTQEHGETCHPLLENSKLKEKYTTCCALTEDYQISLNDFEVVVLYNFSIDAMCKLASGITDTPYTKLAARALMMGKSLYVPKEEVELYRYPKGEKGSYQCMLGSKLDKLVSFGLKICPSAELVDVLMGCPCKRAQAEKCGETASSKPEPQKNDTVETEFSKKVITERDVIQANREGVNVIRLHSKNIMTALAKDAAAARNIRLIRE